MVDARKGQPFETWRNDIHQSHFKTGLTILGLYGASEAIDKIRIQREAALIDAYATSPQCGTELDTVPPATEVRLA